MQWGKAVFHAFVWQVLMWCRQGKDVVYIPEPNIAWSTSRGTNKQIEAAVLSNTGTNSQMAHITCCLQHQASHMERSMAHSEK